MEFTAFVGIDVSKGHIDVFLRGKSLHAQFKNKPTGFVQMVSWLNKKLDGPPAGALYAFENTGLYSLGLAGFMHDNKFMFTVLSGLEVKRSMGITRGKSDKADAKAIAEYAYEKREKVKLYKMPGKNALKLKSLLSLRERMVKERAAYKTRLKEYGLFLDRGENPLLFEAQETMLKNFDGQIKKLDKELQETVRADENLHRQYKLIITIKGVGPQTAMYMIVLTNGFALFENWRKFASYSGIAPFPDSSGKRVGKTKVSHLANKRIKALLSCCACSAIQFNTEMRLYYEQRIKEKKNEMSTLNIVRNKLLSRIFAVVKRGTPYVDTFKYAA